MDLTERVPQLEVSSLRVAYGPRQVLFDVSLHVGVGEIVSIFGHNGAGKTTTLKAILGLAKPGGGTIRYDGDDVMGVSCAESVQRGIAYVAAENFAFSELSVLDNLKLGAYLEPSRAVTQQRLSRVFDLFPILETRRSQVAGTMSGGEQRMLSLGIALMSGPRLLLVDEPSLGLAPALVEQVMELLGRLASEESISTLLVEQNVLQTLSVVKRAYFMRSGRIILEESVTELRNRESYWELF